MLVSLWHKSDEIKISRLSKHTSVECYSRNRDARCFPIIPFLNYLSPFFPFFPLFLNVCVLYSGNSWKSFVLGLFFFLSVYSGSICEEMNHW